MSVLHPSEKSDTEIGKTEPSSVLDVSTPSLRKGAGGVELRPSPSDSPADPLNWPSWKKHVVLYIVSFHAMQGPFSAAIVIPAFLPFVAEFKVPIDKVTYMASVPILLLGVVPLIWTPIAQRIGRRPSYLISAFLSAVCALAGAFCTSFNTLLATRALQAIFISSAQSLGADTVGDMFFAHEKGTKLGIWVLTVTIGPSLGPIIVGFLIQNKGWQQAFYLLAALHFALFFAHLFFAPETLYLNRRAQGDGYDEKEVEEASGFSSLFKFRLYNRKMITVGEICKPLLMFFRPVVLLPTLAYSLAFGNTNVLMTILIPQLFGRKFHFKAGQQSLQLIAILIGGVLGEQLAGRGSDLLVNWRTKRNGGRRVPEFRLVLATPGFLLCILGLMIWGVQVQNITKWNVTPNVGSAIAIFGQQVVTTVCVTYAIESYLPDAADISVFISFLRQVYAFTTAFYFPDTFEKYGEIKSCGIFAGVLGFAMFLPIICNIWGPKWRGSKAQ
ncbi:MFS general substrate transporter [Mycena epipterygia]|nr:MFS general substrate transporter [Mycena epipterygia]